MKKIFSYKILILISIFIILITSLFNTKVFATNDIIINGMNLSDAYNRVPEDYAFVIYSKEDNIYLAFSADECCAKGVVYNNVDGWLGFTPSDHSGAHLRDVSICILDKNTKKFSYLNTVGYAGIKNLNKENILYSSIDIVKHDNPSEVFFQRPLPMILVGEATKAKMVETFQIMTAGLIKSLIVLLISAVALWKGWHFLLTQLKKA